MFPLFCGQNPQAHLLFVLRRKAWVFRLPAAGGTDDVCRIGAVKSLPPPCGGGAGKAPQRAFCRIGARCKHTCGGNRYCSRFFAGKVRKVPFAPRRKAWVFRLPAAGGTDDACRIGAVKSLPPPCGGKKVFSHSPSCRSEQPPPCGGGAGKAPQRAFCRLERDVNTLAAGTGIVPAFLRAKSAKDLYFYRLVLYNKMIKYNKNIG